MAPMMPAAPRALFRPISAFFVIQLVTFHRPMCRNALEPRRVKASRVWESAMVRVLNEILLYSCMAAFVTGIVVLAAATWIS